MIDSAARVARGAYADEPLRTRAHVAGRWRSCPFPAIAAALPATGTILDAGCGHGLFSLYLAAAAPERRVVGVDIDEPKLSIARHAAVRAGLDGRVTFAAIATEWTPDAFAMGTAPPGGWDAIVEVDMLYLLGWKRAEIWMRAAADALAPGGRLIVKESDTRPAWKYRISRLQEIFATRILRITAGDVVELLASSEVAAILTSCGLVAETTRLDRRSLHPHYMVVGTRPGQ